MIVVDTHPHILAFDTVRYPIAPIGGVRSAWSEGLSFSSEELLAQMDDAGVTAATIVQASTVHGNDNSYVADSIARHPERFAGVGGIDPQEARSLDELRYWVRERGLGGMRIFAGGSTIGGASWLDDSALQPFWELATELGIPLNVQVRFEDTARVGRIAAAHSKLPLILDNLALMPTADGPPYAAAQAVFDLARHPNVYLKYTNSNLTSADTASSTPRQLMAALIERFGANRIMWGSNFPNQRPAGASPYKALLDAARDALAERSESDRDLLLGGTARSVYRRWKESPC